MGRGKPLYLQRREGERGREGEGEGSEEGEKGKGGEGNEEGGRKGNQPPQPSSRHISVRTAAQDS